MILDIIGDLLSQYLERSRLSQQDGVSIFILSHFHSLPTYLVC